MPTQSLHFNRPIIDAMKVTVNSIEFALFNMDMPCDKGCENHDLFEYKDICIAVILAQAYLGILPRQELSV